MRQGALGFRVHSGWTALVAVCLDKGAPCVLARERIHLVETFTYELRQPYHTAGKMPLDKAGAFILRVQTQARELAYRAIHDLQSELRKQGCDLGRSGLVLASGKPLPSLDKILASHALIHAGDGELFRAAIIHACERCGLKMESIKERELLERAGQSFRRKPAELLRCVTELGRALGSPWSQDEKFATLAAWLALGSRNRDSQAARGKQPQVRN